MYATIILYIYIYISFFILESNIYRRYLFITELFITEILLIRSQEKGKRGNERKASYTNIVKDKSKKKREEREIQSKGKSGIKVFFRLYLDPIEYL